MNEHIKNYLGIAGTAALAMLTILLVVGVYATYTITQSVDPAQYRTFTVSAEGEIQSTPDIAEFSFSVITEGGTDVAKLQEENTTKANDMVALVKEAGVEDKDIKTSNYSVTPRYQYYRCNNGDVCPPSEIVGYTVSQTVSVKVRNFETIGTMLAGVAEKGANSIYGPSFSLDDPEEARAEARAEAIEKAKKKAEELAKAGGFRIGKLLSIDEGGGYYPTQYRADSMAVEAYGIDGAVEPKIEPGSQDVSVTVTLRYQIK